MKLDITNMTDYNIAAALTGSGIPELDVLKRLITGEIRRACGLPSECCGPLVRDRPTDVEAVRQCVCWLHNEILSHKYLRLTTLHWFSHAWSSLILLKCTRDHWLYRFAYHLYQMILKPYQKYYLRVVLELLDDFTEKGSRIFG